MTEPASVEPPYVSKLGLRIARPSRTRQLARALRTVARLGWAYASSATLAAIPRLRAVVVGMDPCAGSADAAIYVTFDRQARVPDFVVAQVAALAACGRRVTVVSNSPALPAAQAAKLVPHVREIVHRRNIGHDFGAWRDGLARIGPLDACNSLLLMNDSCFGPLSDLAIVEQRGRDSLRDVFGITDSWAHAYHVQSYYLRLSAKVLRSSVFERFWQSLLISQPRSMVISHGEIRLTQTMLAAGFTAGALCPYVDMAALARKQAAACLKESDLLPRELAYLQDLVQDVDFGIPLNPTYFFWDVLLEQGSPFIKRDLLRSNPTQQPRLMEKAISDDILDNLKLS